LRVILTASAPDTLRVFSRLYQNWIAHEVEPDAPGRCTFLEISGYRFRDLLLQIAKILSLRSDAASTIRGIP